MTDRVILTPEKLAELRKRCARAKAQHFPVNMDPGELLSLVDALEAARAELARARRAMVGVNAACRQCGDSLQKCHEQRCCVGCNHSGRDRESCACGHRKSDHGNEPNSYCTGCTCSKYSPKEQK